jgi:hypothetical protein
MERSSICVDFRAAVLTYNRHANPIQELDHINRIIPNRKRDAIKAATFTLPTKCTQARRQQIKLKKLKALKELVDHDDEQETPLVIPEDLGIMSMEELELLEKYHSLDGKEITDDTMRAIMKKFGSSMCDLEMNVYTCAVCDWFKKRKYFHHINLKDTKSSRTFVKHMTERLHWDGVKPKLPPYMEKDFIGVWESRPHFNKILLSIDGFKDKNPIDEKEDIMYVCTVCYDSLKRPCKNNNPPKYALANNIVIGTCELPELTSMQNKMLSLITTRTEVVVYRYAIAFVFVSIRIHDTFPSEILPHPPPCSR